MDTTLARNASQKLVGVEVFLGYDVMQRLGARNIQIPDIKEPLRRHNRRIHTEMMSHLRTLYQNTMAGRPSSESEAALDAKNRAMELLNELHKSPLELGQVRYDRFVSLWTASGQQGASSPLTQLCEQMQYPLGWANTPPTDTYEYSEDAAKFWMPLWHEFTPLLQEF
ncbi:hypothetical protein CISG_02628 [Coccidioides immitis RMSCC 3703]|uniref:Uncharacterized protein n=2 Tax=Coccidioides immitis TaxID=5501 RepID=A0A0J8R8M9_COCIT|nr:hypothetical protein CIRG_09091 [Coccidioides immitis RMSCC 2394]KMU81251.1 hypothetical protein CISG_02628 [Coccidioides immitis RMSCC 3703]